MSARKLLIHVQWPQYLLLYHDYYTDITQLGAFACLISKT